MTGGRLFEFASRSPSSEGWTKGLRRFKMEGVWAALAYAAEVLAEERVYALARCKTG